MKQCTKCKEFKDEGEFSKDKKRKDGLNCWCKACETAAKAARRDHLATLEERTCTACGETKPGKEFSRGTTQCKSCNAAAKAARSDYLASLEERTCTNCGETKQGEEFSRGQVQCKACVAAAQAARHAANKHDKILYVMTHQIYLDNGIVALGETTNSTSRKIAYRTHWAGEVIELHTYPLGDKTDKDVFRYLADHGVLPIYGEFYRYTQKLVELLDSYFLAI